MKNWKTTVTGSIAWVALVSAGLSAHPAVGTYFTSIGKPEIVATLGIIAVVAGILNSSFQRDSSVSDQDAGLRPEVKPEAQLPENHP